MMFAVETYRLAVCSLRLKCSKDARTLYNNKWSSPWFRTLRFGHDLQWYEDTVPYAFKKAGIKRDTPTRTNITKMFRFSDFFGQGNKTIRLPMHVQISLLKLSLVLLRLLYNHFLMFDSHVKNGSIHSVQDN